jgi:DMSO/TMAO reductase YedYZ molybdopterin-dependent catalytic subunit
MSLTKAFEDDTLLAYAFNGEPVPPDHGFPVRAIVPGWVGINNIKWVGRIEVRNSVIDVPTTTKTYVMEGPDYPSKPVLREQTIKSAVALPWGAMLPAGRQRVRGFASTTASTAGPPGSRPRCASPTSRARGPGGTSSGTPARAIT